MGILPEVSGNHYNNRPQLDVKCMRYLIDTNVFVYMMGDKDSLSADVKCILGDYDNTLYISVESLKELIVAYRTKHLLTKVWKTEEAMVREIIKGDICVLPMKPEHIVTYSKMQINEGQNHKDPSDHVIIAQAITEHIPLISSDSRFPFYRTQGLDLVENVR